MRKWFSGGDSNSHVLGGHKTRLVCTQRFPSLSVSFISGYSSEAIFLVLPSSEVSTDGFLACKYPVPFATLVRLPREISVGCWGSIVLNHVVSLKSDPTAWLIAPISFQTIYQSGAPLNRYCSLLGMIGYNRLHATDLLKSIFSVTVLLFAIGTNGFGGQWGYIFMIFNTPS